MKKMTKTEQIKANGGWGATCPQCRWHKYAPTLSLWALKQDVYWHNFWFAHDAYIC